jgi:hypothetical protein
MAFLPDYWWTTDDQTVVTQEASQLLRRYGSYSAHVLAPVAAFAGDADNVDSAGLPAPIPAVIGSGITCSPVPINPTEEKPFYTGQITAWLVQGALRLELWDVTDCSKVIIWPPRESDLRAVSTETGVWIDILAVNPGEDFFTGATTGRISTHMQLAILADVPDTEFYVDANMILNSPDPSETYYEGRSSNDLLLAGNDELSIYKNPLSSFDLSVINLTRRNVAIWPSEAFDIGATARLKVDEFGSLDVTPRIMEITTNLLTEAESAVTLETERQTLTRKLAATQRKRRFLRPRNPEQTNRPANVTGLSGVVG